MILCSAILHIQVLGKKTRRKILTSVPWFYVLGTMAIGFIYAFIFNKIGFIPSTIFFIGALLISLMEKGFNNKYYNYNWFNFRNMVLFREILYISLP